MCFAQFFLHLWPSKPVVSTSPCSQNGPLNGRARVRPFHGDAFKAVDDIDGNTSWPTRRIRSFLHTQHLCYSRLVRQVPTPNKKKGGTYGSRPQ